MFLKLYWLGTALALMPFIIQLQGEHHRRFFPDLPENITNTTFPFNLNTGTTSDIVLVKCPYSEYKHNSGNDSFQINGGLDDSWINELKFQNKALIWTLSMRKSSNQVLHNCGTFRTKSVGSSDKEKDWIYNVIWNVTSQQQTTVSPAHMGFALSIVQQKCEYASTNILVVSKDKESSVPIQVDPNNIKKPYAKQMFYLFIKPNEEDTDTIKKPCIIMKGYHNCPIINLLDYSGNAITSEIKKISIEDLKGQIKNIEVNLIVDGKKDFYRYEEISLSRMRYMKNGPEVIEDSTISITSSFVINGFDLVKLVYNCW
uniref:Ig-like domain-containing protein n=1 Tax=Strongyloides papillosus TaxID=174720 RepID=A0A0N5BEX7_STREA